MGFGGALVGLRCTLLLYFEYFRGVRVGRIVWVVLTHSSLRGTLFHMGTLFGVVGANCVVEFVAVVTSLFIFYNGRFDLFIYLNVERFSCLLVLALP